MEGATLSNGFTYGLLVSGVTPASGPETGGTQVVITGQGFSTANGSRVKFGPTWANDADVVTDSSTQITLLSTPPGTGIVDVTVEDKVTGTWGRKPSAYEYMPPLFVDDDLSPDPNAGRSSGLMSINIYGGGFRSPMQAHFGAVAQPDPTLELAFTVGSATVTRAAGSAALTSIFSVDDVIRAEGGLWAEVDTVDGATQLTLKKPYGSTVTGASSVTGVAWRTTGWVSALHVAWVDSTFAAVGTPGGVEDSEVPVRMSSPTGETWVCARPYLYQTYAAPTISSVTPDVGSESGGTWVTILGTSFIKPVTVTFGGTPSNYIYVTAVNGNIEAMAPAGTGVVDIVVTNAGNKQSVPYPFTYEQPPAITDLVYPPGPPFTGGTLTINGSGFQAGATVEFGPGNASGSVTVVGANQIDAVVPSGSGTVTLIVTNPSGLQAFYDFSYGGATPVVMSVDPNTALAGTVVTINGSGFKGAPPYPNPSVSFEGLGSYVVPAGDVTFLSQSQIQVIVPAGGSPGEMCDVYVSNFDSGAGFKTSAFMYQ
jgi:hypothetical protein